MLDLTAAYDLTFMFPAGDKVVGPALRDSGEFSRVELDFLLEHGEAGQGATLIDVGANIGSIALPFAKARPDWRVIAVEAHRGLAGVLSANALTNRLFNVEVMHAAAGPERSIAEFPATALTAQGNFGELGFRVQGETEPVLMRPLDAFAPPNTALVKVDVEGFEFEVLQGARDLIAAQRATWILEASVQHSRTAAQVIAAFQSAGYQVFWFYVPFATPRSPKRAPANPLTGDANIVALPPGVPNRWSLRPVVEPGESRPGSTDAYPYLARYGYA